MQISKNAIFFIQLLFFCLLSLWALPCYSDVTADDQQRILKSIQQLKTLESKLLEIDEGVEMDALLTEKQVLLTKMSYVLRNTPIDSLPAAFSNKELNFLHSRVATNKERGNKLAVSRDAMRLSYFKVSQETQDFVIYLINSSRSYQTAEQIIAYSEQLLIATKVDFEKFKAPKPNESNAVLSQLYDNYKELQLAVITLESILIVTINNVDVIVRVNWFSRFNIDEAINYFNQMELVKKINFKLSPLNIDGGGVIVSFLIVISIFFWYPLITRLCVRIFEKYDSNENKSEDLLLVYQELNQSIRFLLLWFSLDMATYSLMQHTQYENKLTDLFFIIYVIGGVWFLFKVMDSMVIIKINKAVSANKDLRKELINLGIQFIKGFVFIVATSVALSRFGISVGAIFSTLGIGGLAFALAAKDSLSNFFGGITILIDNIFRMGDWIKIGDTEGTVAEIGLRSTTIRTFDNSLITVPNAVISVSSITNWSRRFVGRRIKMYIGVTYESNMDDIKQALEDIRDMLKNHPNIANPKEKVGIKKKRYKLSSQEDTFGIKSTQLVFMDRYNDFSIDILIYCFSKSVIWSEWLATKEDILFKIAEILEKNNLEFAYPTQVRIHRNVPCEKDSSEGFYQ